MDAEYELPLVRADGDDIHGEPFIASGSTNGCSIADREARSPLAAAAPREPASTVHLEPWGPGAFRVPSLIDSLAALGDPCLSAIR